MIRIGRKNRKPEPIKELPPVSVTVAPNVSVSQRWGGSPLTGYDSFSISIDDNGAYLSGGYGGGLLLTHAQLQPYLDRVRDLLAEYKQQRAAADARWNKP